jgi:tRNA(Ile)-lysidine synthase
MPRVSHCNAGADGDLLGLAISGGVDSMALAALCSGIQHAPKSIVSEIHHSHSQTAAAVLPGIGFQAFVVDHGVREGSDIEARAVSSVLEQRGMKPFMSSNERLTI